MFNCLFCLISLKVVTATEWLEFADLISKNLLQQQHFVLMRYQPFLSVAFHMFFAGPSQQKLSYPSTQYEVEQSSLMLPIYNSTLIYIKKSKIFHDKNCLSSFYRMY